MRSLHPRLWEHTLFPALCVPGELLSLFLFGDALPASWNLTTCMYRSVQSKIQGDSIVALRSSLLLCGFSSGILAALASPNSHLSSLLSKTETAELCLGFPFLSLSLETKAGSRLGRAWSRKGHYVCFPSIRNHSRTLTGI